MFRLFKGCIDVTAAGFSAERFINLTVKNNITLWNIRRENGSVSFSTYAREYRKLFMFAKKTGIKLKITGKRGYPFFAVRYKKRYVFLSGFIVFIAFILYMSSFIWLIEIDGNKTVEDYTVLSVLRENGFGVGVFKYGLSTKDLERCLMDKLNDIAWVNIKINGTRATVTISERIQAVNIENAADKGEVYDIIADKDALITQLAVTSGKPAVRVGDVVKSGDVIISSALTYLKDGEQVFYGSVCAAGTVRGNVKRHFAKTVPLSTRVKDYSGNLQVVYNVKLFNTNFNTNFLKAANSFENYDIIKEVWQPTLGNDFALPLWVEKTTFKEYNINRAVFTSDEATRLAKTQLTAEITAFYSSDCDILDKTVSIKENKNGICAEAEVTATERLGIEAVPVQNDNTIQGGNAVNGATEDTNTE